MNCDISLSIITPTFNRIKVISRSIDSSIELVLNGFAKNIIIVDDASTDNTFNFIMEKYEKFIDAEILLVFRLNENSGVTRARNFGVGKSQCEWIAFMDSDDYFLPESGPDIGKELKSGCCSVYFFRCMNRETGCLIGRKRNAGELTFKQALNGEIPGECLPVIKRETVLNFPYEDALKGCEGVTYLKMLSNGVSAFVSDKVVRGYDDSGDDRLSSKQSIRRRSKQMLMCNLRHIRYTFTNPKRFIEIIARVLYYSYLSIFRK
jgi:glycosyltransferase involved in cell wall biosynthesis